MARGIGAVNPFRAVRRSPRVEGRSVREFSTSYAPLHEWRGAGRTVVSRGGEVTPRAPARSIAGAGGNERLEPRVAQQRGVGIGLGVRRGQQLLAVEDRVRAGEHAEKLRLAR